MARPLDYNQWNNIEVSDDEDDTHPNIDTPSLFKWRHEARVKRMEEMDAKKKFVTDEKKKYVKLHTLRVG
jgi:cell division cycle protein 37